MLFRSLCTAVSDLLDNASCMIFTYGDDNINDRAYKVLSAMLYAQDEAQPARGVLMTERGVSRRVPARPLPERDLWFERVWKAFRETI